MTIHSFVEYKCKYCSADFVPMPGNANCPNCGIRSEEIFNSFIDEATSSASFNIGKFKSALPGAWAVCNIGDWYYSVTFHFISFVAEELKIEQKDVLWKEYTDSVVLPLVSRFLATSDLGESNYLKKHLEIYLVVFLLTAKANLIRIEDELIKSVNKFIDENPGLRWETHFGDKLIKVTPVKRLKLRSELSDQISNENGTTIN